MNIPIIFIHYGDSQYLEYTIKCSKLFNSHTNIILIGDKENKQYSKNIILIKTSMYEQKIRNQLIYTQST